MKSCLGFELHENKHNSGWQGCRKIWSQRHHGCQNIGSPSSFLSAALNLCTTNRWAVRKRQSQVCFPLVYVPASLHLIKIYNTWLTNSAFGQQTLWAQELAEVHKQLLQVQTDCLVFLFLLAANFVHVPQRDFKFSMYDCCILLSKRASSAFPGCNLESWWVNLLTSWSRFIMDYVPAAVHGCGRCIILTHVCFAYLLTWANPFKLVCSGPYGIFIPIH